MRGQRRYSAAFPVRARGDLHGQADVADRLELVEHGVEDRMLEGLAAAPGGGGGGEDGAVVGSAGAAMGPTSKEHPKNLSERLRS